MAAAPTLILSALIKTVLFLVPAYYAVKRRDWQWVAITLSVIVSIYANVNHWTTFTNILSTVNTAGISYKVTHWLRQSPRRVPPRTEGV